ncbi:MAG: cell division protein FtsL [Methylophaga sp.]|nr:cell division protein FtsL [Methylophaga sp.]
MNALMATLVRVRIDVGLLLMVVAVLASAVAVIYSKHTGRSEFIAMQQLENRRDQLNEEWGRLLLEQSTWTTPARVEQQARERLQMIAPANRNTVVITP